ncbi:MAG: MaoC family dehydratase N-terminal domain-containing protein [Myxococcota bacterium]
MAELKPEQKALIGVESEPRPYGGVINESMARFWSQMVEDHNPIYFDEAYGRTTWLGGRIAPPTMLVTWGSSASWPPSPPIPEQQRPRGLQLEGVTATIAVDAIDEYIQPLRYGDTLTVSSMVESVSEEKRTRLGVGHFVTNVSIYRNQYGEEVARHTFRLFQYRPYEEGEER